jgi:hypothetical protein
MKRLIAAVFGFALLQATAAQASILIDTTQVGSDVVFSFSGTFDISGLTPFGTENTNQVVSGLNGAILFAGNGSLDAYTMTDKLPSFGSNTTFGTATGDAFKVFSDDPTVLGFAQGYAGESISGSLTIASSTFVALGLISGVYTTTASNGDFVQLTIPSASTVPLPAGLPLFATGLGALGLLGWRRKRKASALAA